MIDSAKIRLIAKVAGHPAITVIAIITLPFIAYSPIPTLLKLLGFIILSSPIAAMTYRMIKGGGEGGTNFTMKLGQNELTVENIPLPLAESVLLRGMRLYKSEPLPRPQGRIKGNPFDESSREALEGVSLPENVEVASEPIQIPSDASSLSAVNVKKKCLASVSILSSTGRCDFYDL